MRLDLLGAARNLVAPLLDEATRPPGGRVLVGIVGAPGAGKSTLAEALTADLTRAPVPGGGPGTAVTVPMDGFHLSNVELVRLGLAGRKGAPETFDAAGFVQLVRRLRTGDELVYAPAYSRVLHESIGGVIPVYPGPRLVLIEGNYLLLPDQPWVAARPLYDLTIYVDAPAAIRVPGLLRRQRSRGLDETAARDWVLHSDEANAVLVENTRSYADVILSR
jgi:pantothenate kinase